MGSGPQRIEPTAAPPAPTAVRLHSGIRTPTRLSGARPVYPDVARVARVEGTVILEATIDEEGGIRSVTVLRSIPLLDQAALAAVRTWRYTPAHLNGEPIAVIMTVTVTFSLK